MLGKVNAAGHSADHAIPSFAEVTETAKLCFTCPMDRQVRKVSLLPLLIPFKVVIDRERLGER